MGDHQLSGRQCRHSADQRLVVGAAWPAQLFSRLDRRLYVCLGAVRHSDQPHADHHVSRAARTGRRRLATEQPGDIARPLSTRKARHGTNALRRRCALGADRRSDARGLARGQLRLALDFLRQYPGRAPRFCSQLVSGRRSGLSQENACRAAPPTAKLRHDWPGAARAGDFLLGNHAQQGAGMGLARRSVLSYPDIGGDHRRGFRLAAVSRDADSRIRSSISACCATETCGPAA